MTRTLSGPPSREWQPMVTAPKDRPVTGYLPGYGVGSMFWQTIWTGEGYDDEPRKVSGWRIHGMLIEPGEDVLPTHWQSLPDPPVQP